MPHCLHRKNFQKKFAKLWFLPIVERGDSCHDIAIMTRLMQNERLMLENIAMYGEGFDLSWISSSAKDVVKSLKEKNLVFVEGNLAFVTNRIYEVEGIRL